MMSSLLTYLLLTAADPAAVATPAAAKAPTAAPACVRPSAIGKVAASSGSRDDDCDMAIDEVGMPIDKKDKKGKGMITGGAGDCDDADLACRSAAACTAAAAVTVDTAGGHDAQKMAINEQGVPTKKGKQKSAVTSSSPPTSTPWTGNCPTPAGMAINEKGTAGTVKAQPKPKQ